MSPISNWQPLSVSSEQLVLKTLPVPGNPARIRMDIWDFGMLAYFPDGIHFRSNATSAPYLSWTEGSVSDGVPTPDAQWLVLSFRDRQPPVVFGFMDSPASLIVEGRPGDYHIRTTEKFRGWVRIGLPLGLEPFSGSSASLLGGLAKKTKINEQIWTGPPVERQKTTVRATESGLEVAHTLSRKTFALPNGFYFAPLGGYPVKILSPHARLSAETNEGAWILGDSGKLVLRLPAKQIPTGRGLTVGSPHTDATQNIKRMDWSNPLDGVTLALRNAIPGRDPSIGIAASQSVPTFYDSSLRTEEPFSKLSVLYKPTGDGMIASAVHSLLTQSIASLQNSTVESDPQLVSLSWIMDPATSEFLGIQEDVARRTAAITALAGSFSKNPEDRFVGALAQVGLSSSRGKLIDRRRKGKSEGKEELLEPLFDERRRIYSLGVENPQLAFDQVPRNTNIIDALLAPVRVVGDATIWSETQGNDFFLFWDLRQLRSGSFKILNCPPLTLAARQNLENLELASLTVMNEFRFLSSKGGRCSALVTFSDSQRWALPLSPKPENAPALGYSEIRLGLGPN